MLKKISKLFKGDTDHVFVQLFRYTFVGGGAFVVDYGILYLLTEYGGIYYLYSAAIAFLMGLLTNYFISVKWVFSKRNHGKWAEFGIFAGIGVIGLFMNEGIMYVFTDMVGIYFMGSKIISTGIVYFWNFFARKYTLFN